MQVHSHSINTPYQHTLSTHPANTPYQHTLLPYSLAYMHSMHTLSTHPSSTPFQTLSQHPLSPPLLPPLLQGDNRRDGRVLAADILYALGILSPSSGNGGVSSGGISSGGVSNGTISSTSGVSMRHDYREENMTRWDKELRQPTSWDTLFGPPMKEETLANMFF